MANQDVDGGEEDISGSVAKGLGESHPTDP